MALTIVVIDDHPVVVEGIRSWIARDPSHRVTIAHTGTGLADLWHEAALAADVIVLDLELKEGLAVDAIPGLSAAGRRVVAFSQHRDPELIVRVIEAGASAYVTKDEAEEHLVETIVAAAHDRPYVTRSQAKGMLADLRPSRPKLSGRERQALLLWFQGMPKTSVARRMSISEHTVRQYIDRARVKYASVGRDAPTKAALLARAIEDGLITPAEAGDYESFALRPPR
jgi:two-component system, NarL family, nitrate/nitrite response regulator NarL